MSATNTKAEIVNTNNNNTIITWMKIDVLEGRHYIGCEVMYRVIDREQNKTEVRYIKIDPNVEEYEGSNLLFDTFDEALCRVFITNDTLRKFILWDDEVITMDEFSRRLNAFCTTHWVSDDEIIFTRGE